MEQATVEQAEPQGSAAPGQDTSDGASGPEPASSPSFGSLFRQHVETRAARREGRAPSSSAGSETSAQNEQPAPSTRDGARPGTAAGDADGTARADANPSAADDPPRLSRAQRRALKSGQSESEASPGSVDPPDTSPALSGDDDSDPVVARVERVEKTVTEGLSRLEGLLKPANGETGAQAPDPAAIYRDMFGDDQEFGRRADIALHGSQRGQYLEQPEADELAAWAANRKARDFSTGHIQAQFSEIVRAAAQELGVPAEAINGPGTTFRDIFGAFVSRGETSKGAELTAAQAEITRLKAAAQLLADENEAMAQRLPASARAVLGGGASSSGRGAALADRSRMTGRQLMGSGLEQRLNGRRNRPGAR